MKKLARHLVLLVLAWQVGRLYKKHGFKVVGVAGSIGKTSTKLAIANVLQQKYRVQYQEGNYNDLITVPLIFFGQPLPSLLNPVAWLRTFVRNESAIKGDYPYDVVVVEVGTDYPGNVVAFGKYLRCDIGVVTAIAPEHMEFFGSIEQVAKEELAIAGFSKQLIINQDLCDQKYTSQLSSQFLTYGSKSTYYQISNMTSSGFSVLRNAKQWLKVSAAVEAMAQRYSITAAAAVAEQLGLSDEQILKGAKTIQPVSGRLQRLPGVQGSTIIDDTYNASPDAVIAALDDLYAAKANYKVAVLGSMNELGEYSPEAHNRIGRHCDPQKLDLLVTIGADANDYLAPVAQKQGCQVQTFSSPYAAGGFVKKNLKPGSLILVKGSQNNVFAEEAVKLLLANPADTTKLVRQSQDWLVKKRKRFSDAD